MWMHQKRVREHEISHEGPWNTNYTILIEMATVKTLLLILLVNTAALESIPGILRDSSTISFSINIYLVHHVFLYANQLSVLWVFFNAVL